MNVDHLVTMTVQSQKKEKKDENDKIWEGLSYILVFALIVPDGLLVSQDTYMSSLKCSRPQWRHPTQTSPTKSQLSLEKCGL